MSIVAVNIISSNYFPDRTQPSEFLVFCFLHQTVAYNKILLHFSLLHLKFFMQFRENYILHASSFGSNETEGSIPPLFSFVILVLFPLQNKPTWEVNIFIFYCCSLCDSLPGTSGRWPKKFYYNKQQQLLF